MSDLHLTASDKGVTAVSLGSRPVLHHEERNALNERRGHRELAEYLIGKRRTFTVTVDLDGTPFQRTVWSALQSVPYGSTMTYGQLAKKIGRPRAVRAVASAVAKNPVGIVIPCHRIVPASGSQPGKYAWGTKKKEWLLEHEKRSAV
ncbi:MAG: methylated-DNA--[protein]-cysteine S-methyltransferase [Candidatus Peribacteraceae bacterium]|nr:methylated-DNA--[protein]-cysteine S-methyltransferase [Candidatus Peribacteraceae bacterium]